MTIKVTHTPRKEVYIHEMAIYDSVDDMLDTLTAGIPPGVVREPLRWVNGILLTFNPIPTNSEFIIKERAQGILRWDHVSFALMTKYEQGISLSNGVSVNIIDVSNNETFSAIGKFLKTCVKKKSKK